MYHYPSSPPSPPAPPSLPPPPLLPDGGEDSDEDGFSDDGNCSEGFDYSGLGFSEGLL